MARLIDADALIVAVLDHGVDYVQTDDLEEINQIINDAPTIDAVPVVRCRECKWGRTTSEGSEYVWCGKPYAPPWLSHIANWYCADGKRKEVMQDETD